MTAKKIKAQSKEKNTNISITRFSNSSLFNEALVFRDIQKELKFYWENEETSGFIEFWHFLCHYAIEYNKLNKENYNSNETLEKIVLPVLEILGYGDPSNKTEESYILNQETPFLTENGDEKNISIPLIVVKDNISKKSIVNRDQENYQSILRDSILLPVVYDYFDSFSDERNNSYDSTRVLKTNSMNDEYSYLGNVRRTVEYLKLLGTNEFSICTDGAKWRIVSKEKTNEDSSMYFEFDLHKFFELMIGMTPGEVEEEASFLEISKWFFWFFSKNGLCSNGLNFVSEVSMRAKKYASTIEEDMKTRFVHSVTVCTNGYAYEMGKDFEENSLDLLVNTSESLVFNLFFLRSCESKGAIPFHQGYKKISLANLLNKMEHYSPDLSWEENKLQLERVEQMLGVQLEEDGKDIYEHIQTLFSIIKDGKNGFGIHAFTETVFGKDELGVYNKYSLPNKTVLKLLHEMMFYRDESSLKQIPYNSFTPRQLGTIYESFLEFKPFKATKNLYYLKKKSKKSVTWQWVSKSEIPAKVSPNSLYMVKKGEFIFSPDNKQRKTTGSYYTPHDIVEFIVSKSLEPITNNISKVDDILNISVCDPSMGSAHFLVEALTYLTNKYKKISPNSFEGEAVVKRKILDSCIYGVDLNERAVKLAKMSLWLATAYPGKKLERLDDQLKSGNSLLLNKFNWEKEFPNIFKHGGFSAVLGNPPWISLTGKHGQGSYTEEVINYLISEFNGNTYMPNTYEYFMSLFMRLAKKDDGVIGLIVPDRFGFNNQFVSLRKKMLDSFSLRSLVYKADFPGVVVDTLIIIAEKNKNEGNKIEISEGFREKQLILQDSYDKDDFVFQYTTSSESSSILDKLVKSEYVEKVSDYCLTTSGFGGKSKLLTDTQKNKKQIKVLKGNCIQKYRIINSLWFDFCKDNLTGRTTDRKKLGANPKVLLRKTGIDIIATPDFNGIYPEQSLYFLYDLKSKNDAYFLTAYLNSNILNFYYQEVAVTNKNSIAQLKKVDLDLFPLPVKVSDSIKAEVVELCKKMHKKGYDVDIQSRINEIFYEVFGLDDREVEFIENYLSTESLDEAA